VLGRGLLRLPNRIDDDQRIPGVVWQNRSCRVNGILTRCEQAYLAAQIHNVTARLVEFGASVLTRPTGPAMHSEPPLPITSTDPRKLRR
jgi:hypothetical protein